MDLASKDYRDIGVALLRRDGETIDVTPILLANLGLVGRPEPVPLVDALIAVAMSHQVRVIGLDGPQGWKDPDNGHRHARACEVALHTQGKTGPAKSCKPGNYLPFISFCVETFDALDERGWPRFDHSVNSDRVAVETFPTSAWRSLGLTPLPGKGAASKGEPVREWTDRLAKATKLRVQRPFTHDELQAAVSGIGLLALAEGKTGWVAAGLPPARMGSTWLEGYIVNPQSPL